MLWKNGQRRVEIRLHFCVPVTKVGGYMEESLNRGFCLIGGGRRVEIRLLSPCSKVGGYAGDSLIGGFCLIGGGRRVEIRLHFCSVRCKNRGSGGRSLPPTVHRTVGFNFSNLLSDKNCRPPLWGSAIFGGECEIRTHGALPHHRFSRPAP